MAAAVRITNTFFISAGTLLGKRQLFLDYKYILYFCWHIFGVNGSYF
jgi:hypothetical protein